VGPPLRGPHLTFTFHSEKTAKNMMSPTARTLYRLRKQGYIAGVVERFIPHRPCHRPGSRFRRPCRSRLRPGRRLPRLGDVAPRSRRQLGDRPHTPRLSRLRPTRTRSLCRPGRWRAANSEPVSEGPSDASRQRRKNTARHGLSRGVGIESPRLPRRQQTFENRTLSPNRARENGYFT
jgi:hypothetical protein